MKFSESIQAINGKFIRIVNDANTAEKAGLYGESVDNSVTIGTTDPRVTVDGSVVVVDLDDDLDFSNNYHIEIDAGAFVGQASGLENVAIADPSTLAFSTVTPSADRDVSSSEGASVMLSIDGTVSPSVVLKDIEGWPGGKTGDLTTIDLGSTEFALVSADRLDTPSLVNVNDPFDGSAATNVTTGDFNLVLNNFGADDLIYLDDLGRGSDDNSLTRELIFAIQANSDNAVTVLNFDAATVSGQLKDGGRITIQGQSFADLQEWQSLLNTSNELLVFGSSGSRQTETGLVITSGEGSAVKEDQNVLYTAAVTGASGTVSYSLGGSDAGVLRIGAEGVVTLALGDLEFDGVDAKRVYDFEVIATDGTGSKTSKVA